MNKPSRMATVTVTQLFNYVDGLLGKEVENSSEEEENVDEFKPLKIGEMASGNTFPETFSGLVEDYSEEVHRIGLCKLIRSNKENTDISFYTALMYCCRLMEISVTEGEQQVLVRNFLEKLQYDYYHENLFTKFEIKNHKIKKKDLGDRIGSLNISNQVILFLAHYFDINVFVLMTETGRVVAYYPEQQFNRFKMTMMLISSSVNTVSSVNDCEPLVPSHETSRLWKYNDPFFYHLIYHFDYIIDRYDPTASQQDSPSFHIGQEDLGKYMTETKNATDDESIEVETISFQTKQDRENHFDEIEAEYTDDGVFIEEDGLSDKPFLKDTTTKPMTETNSDQSESGINEKLTVNSKSTLQELQKIAIKMGISLNDGKYKNGSNKMKTKKQLYNDIIQKK